jgi:phi13 family phage major tail protein
MTGNKSTKANRINIVDPVYAVIQSDTKEGTTYGEVKKLGAAMQVQLTASISSGVLYGDGVQQENISKLNGIALVVDVNKINIEDRSAILGNKYENGVIHERAGDEAPYIAVGYKVEQTNKKVELIWLLKGRAQPTNSSVQQSTENFNFSTDSITVNFIPRDSDKELRFFADSANGDLTQSQIDAWFLTGPSKAPIPTA